MSKRSHERTRGLYADLFSCVLINFFFVILWSLGDSKSFWPLWPIIIWGAILLTQFLQVDLLFRPGVTLPLLRSVPFFRDNLPFLSENWRQGSLSRTAHTLVSELERVGLESAKHSLVAGLHKGESTQKNKKVAPEKGASNPKKTKEKGQVASSQHLKEEDSLVVKKKVPRTKKKEGTSSPKEGKKPLKKAKVAKSPSSPRSKR